LCDPQAIKNHFHFNCDLNKQYVSCARIM
jgi:hypothetical protein